MCSTCPDSHFNSTTDRYSLFFLSFLVFHLLCHTPHTPFFLSLFILCRFFMFLLFSLVSFFSLPFLSFVLLLINSSKRITKLIFFLGGGTIKLEERFSQLNLSPRSLVQDFLKTPLLPDTLPSITRTPTVTYLL